MNLADIIREHLGKHSTGWSMGSIGAIAEFHHHPDDPVPERDAQSLSCVTARGGIRFDRVDDVIAVAYETLSAKPYRWTHGVALCLPAIDAQRNRRCGITELGPDRDALRPQDRDAILFDVGVCAANDSQRCIDFCVRTDDPELLAALRAGAGRSFLDPDNPAMPPVLAKSPHRVVLSSVGRVEVYQPIADPAAQGIPPIGPHTHLLPKLMANGRLFSANLPIPDGLVPGAMMYPGNPTMSALGEDCEFDPALHDSFQQLFWHCGAGEQCEIKRRALHALAEGEMPDGFAVPDSRAARTAVRVLCRQLARDRRLVFDEQLLKAWSDAFEPGADADSRE